jgi:hypothetical protein
MSRDKKGAFVDISRYAGAAVILAAELEGAHQLARKSRCKLKMTGSKIASARKLLTRGVPPRDVTRIKILLAQIFTLFLVILYLKFFLTNCR